MYTELLFPNRLKVIGWVLLIPSSILGILTIIYDFAFKFLDVTVWAIVSEGLKQRSFFTLIKNNITDELIGIIFIIGAVLVAFSKLKHEDEFIAKLRLESLVWATYVNYIILAFCILFIYGIPFLTIMQFNMFTILIFFIIRFYYMLYQSKKTLNYEK